MSNLQNHPTNQQTQIPTGPTKACKHCKSIIPKAAKSCPICHKKQSGIKKWIIIAIVVIILAALGGSTNDDTSNQAISDSTAKNTDAPTNTNTDVDEAQEDSTEMPETEVSQPTMSEDEFKASCQPFDYKTIARTPEDYVGQNFVVDVKVTQTINGKWHSDYDVYYKTYTNDEYDMWLGDFLYIIDYQNKDSESYLKVLEDDVIRVYGTFNGMTQSENALTGTTNDEISLDMHYCELIAE